MAKNGPSQPERTWAMIAHVSTFFGYLIPLGHVLAPLAVWLGQRKYSSFVEHHAREALNFQISVTLYLLAAELIFRKSISASLGGVINLFVIGTVVVAAWRSHHGQDHTYPLSIRFVR